jgi:hypothetical protein
MKTNKWIYLLISVFLSLSSCGDDSHPIGPSNRTEPQLLIGSYIYLGTAQYNCGMDYYSNFYDHTWYIFLDAPDTTSIGVYFWIEPFAFGPEDSVSITPSDGISYEGDLFGGITISWMPNSFEHESLLTLDFIDNPPFNYQYQWSIAKLHDSELFLDNGGSVYLEDVASTPEYCPSWGGGTTFQRPDSFTVDIGKDAIIIFKGIGTGAGWGPAATDIHAVDELGWVGDLTPDHLWVTCSICPWWWTDFELSVSVPLHTHTGTRNLVTILDGRQETLTSFELIAHW